MSLVAGTAAGHVAERCASLSLPGHARGARGRPAHRFYDGRVALLEAGVACAPTPPHRAGAPNACARAEAAAAPPPQLQGIPAMQARAEPVKQSMLGSRVGGSGRLRT